MHASWNADMAFSDRGRASRFDIKSVVVLMPFNGNLSYYFEGQKSLSFNDISLKFGVKTASSA
jgi:hypothetical protein